MSSSSVSGSESDPGFYTNDDGREADDEQSDWYQESGPTWGVPGIKPCWWEKDSAVGIGQDFRFRSGNVAVGEDDVVDGEDTEDDGLVEERKLHQLLKGPWMHLSDEAKDAYKLRMQKLRDRIVRLIVFHEFVHMNLIGCCYFVLLAWTRNPSRSTPFGSSAWAVVQHSDVSQ